MKMLAIIVFALVAIGVGGFFFLAMKSQSGAAPGLVNGILAPCPPSPNCVSSEEGTPESHAVSPLPAEAWEQLPQAIETLGGVMTDVRDDYMAAEFSSKVMRFVDDVEFRKDEMQVHVRSASRVGYGDMGVNRKRVEELRAMVEK